MERSLLATRVIASVPPPTTRQRVLDLVGRGPVTVPELSKRLGIARNAVVLQLQKLVADGLIQRTGHQRTGDAGKPCDVYELMPGSEDVGSQAYRPLVGQILAVLKDRLRPDEISEILEEAGERLARDAGLASDDATDERLARAVAAVNSLGACAEIVEYAAGRIVVENRRCPFAHAVRRDPCVCHAAAAFFRTATGLPFEVSCERHDTLTCRYVASAI